MGQSIFFHKPVLDVIADRAETSLLIAVLSMILIIVVGVPIGILSAVRYNSWLDQFFSGASMFFASIPTFWLGLNLMLLFAVSLRWLPTSGFPSILESGDWSNLRYLVLPCITLAAPNSALIIRLTRSSMLDVARADYVKTAWAKGLSEGAVTMRHIFRNSLIWWYLRSGSRSWRCSRVRSSRKPSSRCRASEGSWWSRCCAGITPRYRASS